MSFVLLIILQHEVCCNLRVFDGLLREKLLVPYSVLVIPPFGLGNLLQILITQLQRPFGFSLRCFMLLLLRIDFS